ncbi:MAG: hypothetical protein ACXADC_16385, partial [Candidatus Thorarchaeota archaeon]
DNWEFGYESVPVTSGTDATGYDFENFKWMNITGHKLDYDSGDGLNNWKIRLYNSTGHLVDETTTYTDATHGDGYYSDESGTCPGR